MILSPRKVFVRGSLELGFSSVRHNANPTQGVNFQIPCVRIVGTVVMWELVIHTFWSLQNSVTSPGCDFVPPDQIVIVSLNGFRRRVATHHSTQTVPQIDETPVMLDSWHQFQLGGPLSYDFVTHKSVC
jgi:hypothetical protein